MKENASIRWLRSRSAAANAAARLPELAADFFSAGRALAAADSGPAEAHQFRIRTKRLRYTLELFQPCYGAGLKRRLDSLRGIQQLLGELNDLATIARLANRPAIEELMKERVTAKIGEFRRLWGEQFDRPGAEADWKRYLRGRPRRPVRKRVAAVG